MRNAWCLSFSLVLTVFSLQAQDTTVTYSTSYADTVKIGTPSPDPYLFLFNMQELQRGLMKPLNLKPDLFITLDNPLSRFATTPFLDFDSYENKLQSVNKVKQSITLNLRAQQNSDKIAGTIGFVLGVASWGGVIYQMTNPKPNPNLRPGGPPPPKAPAVKGNPRPMR